MHIKKVKLNNSYTTYIVVEDDAEPHHVMRRKLHKEVKWESGCKVVHAFHGEGVICKLNDHQIVVKFAKSKALRNARNFTISFEYFKSPKEIGNLKLCI